MTLVVWFTYHRQEQFIFSYHRRTHTFYLGKTVRKCALTSFNCRQVEMGNFEYLAN